MQCESTQRHNVPEKLFQTLLDQHLLYRLCHFGDILAALILDSVVPLIDDSLHFEEVCPDR